MGHDKMETAGKIKGILSGLSRSSASLTAGFKKLALPVWKVLSYCPLEEIIPSSVLCVSIARGRVDVLSAKRAASRYRILASKALTYSEDAFPSPDETASAVSAAMKEFGISKADAVLLIPKSWVILKPAELPAAVQENLKEVISYEFDRFTPFSSYEALYDYYSESRPDDKAGILLAATKADTTIEYIDKLTAKMVSVRRLDFDISALAALARFASGNDTFIFAEIGPSVCSGGFVQSCLLRSASVVEFASADDNRKAEETENFICNQKKSWAAQIPSVPVLLAFSEGASSIRSAMSTRAKVPFRNLSEFRGRMTGLAGSKLPGHAPAGGAIEYLWPGATGFNLLSKGERDRASRPFLVTTLLLTLLALCLALYLFVPIKTESNRLAAIEKLIAKRKAEVTNIEKIRTEIETLNRKTVLIDNFKHDRPAYIGLIKGLTELIPKTAWLTRVRIVGMQVNIEGYANSATALIQLLEASKYFRNVEFSSPTFRDPQMNMDRFQIKMLVRDAKSEGAAGDKK
jgi:Tfp pilus assembly protein PilN